MQQQKENIIIQWFVWHFYEMPKFLFSVYKNYILFGLDFFSAPLLLATLFSPWKKYRWAYPKFFSPTEILSTFVSNAFSRIIGAICRIFLILLSIPVVALIIVIGFLVILFWILMPFIIIVLIFTLYAGI